MSDPTSKPTPSLNRRQFLGNSARNAAQAAAGVVGLAQVSQIQARSLRDAHSEVRIGVVGLRNQGASLLGHFQQVPGCQVSAVCDIDPAIRQQALAGLEAQGQSPMVCDDFRQLLDRRDLDAIVIATPDHHHAWMTALACDAGKAVYLEAPTTHTLSQGQQLRTMIRNTNALVQVGLQQRSGSHYLSAIEFLHSGQLGQVRYAKAWACVNRQRLKRKESAAEAGRMPAFAQAWLGEEATNPLHAQDWHFHWRWLWSFGSGELGAWGVHLLDIARWGLNVSLPQRVSASGGCYHLNDGRETPDTLTVQYDFGGASIVWEHRQWSSRGIEGRPHGVAFYGERGVLIIDRSGWKVYDHSPSVSQPAGELAVTHARNFIDAIRLGTPLAASFEVGHVSTQLCHLGNLAYQQGHEWRADEPVVQQA